MSNLGKFNWFDLFTSDTVAAISFYEQVVGWKTMPWDEGDKPYTMFAAGESPIGGVMELPEELKVMDVPPHWIGYIGVDDVDATAGQAQELGGVVHKEAWDIPNVGRVAVLADPQGAVFSIFCPVDGMGGQAARDELGVMSWSELNTTDYESAWKFYSALLGWQETETMDMGPEAGIYFMFKCKGAEASLGGMSNVAKSMGTPPHWLHYTNVSDIETAVAQVAKGGGQTVNGPMEVPGGSMVAMCIDPQGAAFALHATKVEKSTE